MIRPISPFRLALLIDLQPRRRLAALGSSAVRARPAAAGLLLFVLLLPVLSLLHELLVMGAAGLLDLVGALGLAALAAGLVPLDPVYTSTLFHVLSAIDVSGIAVAWPLGEPLRAALPGLFTDSSLVVDGSAISAVIQPGASTLSRLLVELAADSLMLVVGLLLVRGGLRGRHLLRVSLVTAGALIQARVAIQCLLEERLSLAELEATGLSYGFSVLFSGPAASRPRLSALLLPLPDAVRDLALTLPLLLLAYVLALALIWSLLLPWCLLRARARRPSDRPTAVAQSVSRYRRPLFAQVAALMSFAILITASPLGAVADASSNYLGGTPASHPDDQLSDELRLGLSLPGEPSETAATITIDGLPPGSTREPPPALDALPALISYHPIALAPSRVSLKGAGYRYDYRVNGEAQIIRGMGYNPMLAAQPTEVRAPLYDRDFALMQDAGVNTLVGWTTEEFDELLLDQAAEHELGVILPYHLDPALDYRDAAVRATVRQDVLAWVSRYRDHPAIRMWGLGNEVLHKLIYPSWMQLRGDADLETRADAFSSFFVDLIDAVNQLDPSHPIVYRDAEDAYLPRLRDALIRDGKRREWFAYGINIYTPRLADVLEAWPQEGLDAALLISEFAPGGAGPADRPRGYTDLWAMIRAQPGPVIGGAPYVWYTEGPEEVDRVFGLVDPSARPVDGSLAAIRRFYREDEQSSRPAPPSSNQIQPTGPPAPS